MAGRLRPRGDDGQMVTALIVFAVLGLVFMAVSVLLPWGQAVDLRNGSQTASDAAALGAVDELQNDITQSVLDALVSVTTPEDLLTLISGLGLNCSSGSTGAQSYAAANDATVTSYCYDVSSGVVDVTVRGNQADDTSRTQAVTSSRARLPRLGPCRLIPDDPNQPIPTPTPPAPTPPTSPPPPASPVGATLECGDLSLHFTIPATLIPHLDTTEQQLKNELKPRLIG